MLSRHLIPESQRSTILAEIHVNGPVSRAELARRLNLRPSSVSEFVRDLMAQGLLVEVGEGNPNGGRPPVLVDVDRRHNYALGLTIEPRRVTAAVVRWDGTILDRILVPLSADSELAVLMGAVEEACHSLLSSAEASGDRLRGIGVGISALVDPRANEAVFSSTLVAARRLRLDGIAERFGLPVYLEDVAYMMALGERWFVYPADKRALVLVYMGGGTCGAVLEPWAGPDDPRFAAEFGHVVVDPGGPVCGCGKRGCLEAFVSEKALLSAAERLFGSRTGSPPSLEDVAELARSGDGLAKQLVASSAEHLGVVMSNVVNILAPALMVVGGPIVDAWEDLLLPELDRCLREHSLSQLLARVEVVRSRLGADAALMGSAARVMQAVFRAPSLEPERPESLVTNGAQ